MLNVSEILNDHGLPLRICLTSVVAYFLSSRSFELTENDEIKVFLVFTLAASIIIGAISALITIWI